MEVLVDAVLLNCFESAEICFQSQHLAEVWKGAAMEKFPPKDSIQDFKDRIWFSTLHHEDSRVVSGL
ncbi:hypothetical protein SADUNF_Sadunf07G0102400 [Salix dunnii]|uniref:Uncharacterized protein n=1 Tax=Salix dunnii TaxID=1413687 RepID=A0A835K471_9ROSI|nr:hypothetical protein SADUNF_Sadunf07G0102400 [Salix dunnii]